MPRITNSERGWSRRRARRQVARAKPSTPGSGVVAPGYKPVRKGGKVVPKRTAPKSKSPVFRPLPKAGSKSSLPGKSKESRRTVIKSAPNPLRVSASGQTYRQGRYVPGTLEYQKAKLKSRSLGGDVYRALQKEEKRQEKLIRAVTGEKVNVELRNTKDRIMRGVSSQSKTALGAEPEVKGSKKNPTPTLSTLNRNARAPEVREQQAKIDSTRTVAQAQAKETKKILNPQALPLKGGPGLYDGPPATPGQQKARAAAQKPLKTPKVLQPGRSLPRVKGQKPYAYKQRDRQARYAVKEQGRVNKRNARTLLNRKAPLEKRARAGDALSRAGVIQTETRKQFRARQKREAARRRALAKRKPLVDVKLDAGDIAGAAKGSAKFVAGLDPRRVGAKAGRAAVRNAPEAFEFAKKTAAEDIRQIKNIDAKDVSKGADLFRKALGAGMTLQNPALAIPLLASDRKALEGAIRGVNRAEVRAKQGKLKPRDVIAATAGFAPNAKEVSKKIPGGLGNLAKVPVYSAEAIAENPGEQIPRLVKDYAEMIKSVPAGIYMTVDQGPETVWQQIKKDYSRRYGALLKGKDKEFRKRLENEGVAAEVLDSFAVLTAVGKGVGAAGQAAATSRAVARAAAKPGRVGGAARAVRGVATRTTIGGEKAGSPRAVAQGGEVELRPTNNIFENLALAGVDAIRGARKIKALDRQKVKYKKSYEIQFKRAKRDGRSDAEATAFARATAGRDAGDLPASIRESVERGALRGDRQDIDAPRRGVRPEDVKAREGTVRVKISPSAAAFMSKEFNTTHRAWEELGVRRPVTAGDGTNTEVVNVYRASGDPRAEMVAQMLDTVEVEMARSGMAPLGRRPFTEKKVRSGGRKAQQVDGKRKSIEVELPVKQAEIMREFLLGRRGFYQQEQFTEAGTKPFRTSDEFVDSELQLEMGNRIAPAPSDPARQAYDQAQNDAMYRIGMKLLPIYREQVDQLVSGAISIGAKSKDPALKAAAKELRTAQRRSRNDADPSTLLDDLTLDVEGLYLLERSGLAMKKALPKVKPGQARSDQRLIFDKYVDPTSRTALREYGNLQNARVEAARNRARLQGLKSLESDLAEQLRVQGNRKAMQDSLPETQRELADALTDQQVADVGRRTALGDQIGPGARFNPDEPTPRSNNTRQFLDDMDAITGSTGGMRGPRRLNEQALRDYESDWPFYGAVNLHARALRDIDPEFIVQFDRRYLSGLLTGREIAQQWARLAGLFNMKQFRGSKTFVVGEDVAPFEPGKSVFVKRALPANAQFIDPVTGEKVFLGEVDVKRGAARLQDEGFISTSLGEGRGSAEFNNFINNRVTLQQGTAIIIEVPPGTKMVLTDSAQKLRPSELADGEGLYDGVRGEVEGENEAVLAPDSVLELSYFKSVDELVEDYDNDRRFDPLSDQPYEEETFRKFWDEAIENHNRATRNAFEAGDITAEQRDRALWKGVPVFKITSPETVRTKIRAEGLPGRFTEAQLRAQARAARAEVRLDDEADAIDAAGAVKPLTNRRAIARGFQEQVVPMVFSNKWFGYGGQLRRRVARASGAAFLAMRIEQSEVEKLFRRELAELSDAEREAFFYSLRFGIRTPEQARALLGEWRDSILALRADKRLSATEASAIAGDMWHVFDEVPNIENLIRQADLAFTPRLADFSERMRVLAREKGLMDPTLNSDRLKMRMAEIGAQGRIVGVRLEDFTADPLKPTRREKEAYIRAVEAKRKELGLAQAGFFRGERRPRRPFADRAVGGTQAVLPDKPLRFKLIEYGASDTDPEVFLRGVMGNIKRRYNYNKVAEVVDAVGSRTYRNMTAGRLLDAIDAGDVDLRDSVIWNPRAYNRTLEEQGLAIAEAEREAVRLKQLDRGLPGVNPLALGDKRKIARQVQDDDGDLDTPNGQARVHDAIVESAISGSPGEIQARLRQIAADEEFLAQGPSRNTPGADYERSGFMVIPKAAYDEIFASTKPSGAALRTLSIAQGKVSRVLLANPVWLQFQFASNAFLTGLVSGTGPVSIIKAQRWWNKLPEEQKRAVSPYVGIHRWYDPQNKIGAAQFTGSYGDVLNGLVNGFRGMKTSDFYQKALFGKSPADANPLTLILKGDNSQNNWFRRAVLYNSVKREAYRQMGEDMGQAIRIQQQLVDSVTGLGPEEAMRKLLSQRDQIEQHAAYVDSILGNWNTYTNFERRVMGRFVMFYGFLRFSTKLTFYTMPMKHPLTSAIMLKLGELQRDELRRIFGADIPYWEIGNYYDSDGENVRIEVARLNPFFNLYSAFLGQTREQIAAADDTTSFASQPFDEDGVQYDLGPEFAGLDPRNLFTFVPPYFTLLADQFTRSSNALGGKPWTSDGNATWDLPGKSNIGLQDRLQIMAAQMLRLSPYYRALERTGLPGREANTPFGPLRGKQTSDSTIFAPNPVTYSTRDVRGRRKVRKNEKMIRDQEKNALRDVGETLGPVWVGTPGEPRIDSARAFEKDRPGKKKKKKAKRKNPITIDGLEGLE